MNVSTSTLMAQMFGVDLNRISEPYARWVEDLVRLYPEFSTALDSEAKNRAAYLIPHLFVELGYQGISGVNMDEELSDLVIPFSTICLLLAIGDDIIDPSANDFERRMTLGCLSTMLMNYAYTNLLVSKDKRVRDIVMHEISQLLRTVISTGAEEIEYRRFNEFSLNKYLLISRKKTSCYTKHGLFLAAKLLGKFGEYRELLAKLGESAGTAIQLVDDLLDVHEDNMEANQQVLTYPMFLKANRESMLPMVHLVQTEFSDALELCTQLPYPTPLLDVLSGAKKLYSNWNG